MMLLRQLLGWSKWIPFYIGLVSRYSYDMPVMSRSALCMFSAAV
jgi:hypothetical protein